MKFIHSLVLLSCVLWEAMGYPYSYYPSYGNMDSCKYLLIIIRVFISAALLLIVI